MKIMCDETEKFIAEVKKYPIIWDPRHKDFRHGTKREEAWYNITESFGFEARFNTNWKRKWKNLKDCFRKYLKSESKRRAKKQGDFKPWPWAAKLEFIRPFCIVTPPTYPTIESEAEPLKQWFDLPDGLNSDENLEFLEHEELDFVEVEDEKQKEIKPLPQLNDTTTDHVAIANPIQTETEHINVDCLGYESPARPSSSSLSKARKRKIYDDSGEDDIELILLGYAKSIRKFSPRRQAMVKYKFSQILMKAELEQLKEDDYQASSSAKKTKKSKMKIEEPLSSESSD